MGTRRHTRNEGSAAPDAPDGPPDAASAVVGLGASAGGLEALRQLLGRIPTDTRMAFVVIQHLDPEHPSLLTRVLASGCALQVVEAAEGMAVRPGHVHVMPAHSDLSIDGGTLHMVPREKTGQLHLPIDSFFRSLAQDQRRRAIGIVLSGSGADGTIGLRAIRAEGGITLAQEPGSAQFSSMPESALAAGVVDFRGTPEEIAVELVRLVGHPYLGRARDPDDEHEVHEEPRPDEEKNIAAVLAHLRRHAGVDFGGYKRKTVLRRIERRMALRHLGALGEYEEALRDEPAEARVLARDMLIHVTSFFRDREAFDALASQAFTEIIGRMEEGGTIRVWVPGCSSGEEAYAIGMGLLETMEAQGKSFAVRIFATDLSDESIDAARRGVFPEAALVDLDPERVARFFDRTEGGFRVSRQVRDLCVFVKHDLTRDAPFARLDLVSCRNVLIYFDAELQRRIVPMLHYCLRQHGYLFLGQSESLSGFRDLFAPVDKTSRIFVKTGNSPPLLLPLPGGHPAVQILAASGPVERPSPAREAQRQADHLVLARHAPPGVIVNERLEVVQFRGRTGAWLEPAPGQPQSNVLRMAREGLAPHIHDAIERARAGSSSVRKEGLQFRLGAETRTVNLEVLPLSVLREAEGRHFLILFEEPGGPSPGGPAPAAVAEAEAGPVDDRLRAEFAATQDYLQSIVSDHQLVTDELAAANEELVAANEELQSANEELQSAKEELQSTNEELSTLNDQLRDRNQELDRLANDLVNVLASVDIPVIIVDLELRVRRFTPTMNRIARLIAEDVGRPIDDLRLRVEVDDLPARIHEVIEGLAPREWEIQDRDAHWFRMQIRPYHTADNRLDGAVLSFVDVDDLKHALRVAEDTRDYAKTIVESVTSALVVLDDRLRTVSFNRSFLDLFALDPRAASGGTPLPPAIAEEPALRMALEEAVSAEAPFSGLEVEFESGSGRRVLSLSGTPMHWPGGALMILLAIENVTTLRVLQSQREALLASEQQARRDAERANRAKDLFLATLSHELRTPLSTILMSAHLLKRLACDDARIERASAAIERSAGIQARLIEDLLDISRIVSGKLHLDMGPLELEPVLQEAVETVRPSAMAKALDLAVAVEAPVGTVYGDPARLRQVVDNLLSNAIKFTPHGGRISVRLTRVWDRALIEVRDTGIGIRPDMLPHLFGRFVQADSSISRSSGGLGLGLAIVRHLVEAHGGEIQAESAGEGLGATFRVMLPTGTGGVTLPVTATAGIRSPVEGLRVLLVDDDEDGREAYASVLAALGAEVRTAASSAEALRELAASRPDVVLCDLAMPGEDGFEFIRTVRGLPPEKGGDVPAAALTALAGEDSRERAVRAGFQLHIAKPVAAETLAVLVGRLVGR